MLGNALTVPIGLWLAYRAIFAAPPGADSIALMIGGIAIVVLAIAARFRSVGSWQAVTNIVLGFILAAYAAMRMFVGDFGFGPLWITLLTGSTAAILALWAILYRPDNTTSLKASSI